MIKRELADTLVRVASEQLHQGLQAKEKRMNTIAEIIDLYNNKTIELEDDVANIPFPILGGHLDLLFSKIDNPPSLTFKLPNRATLSDKIQSAWTQEMSSTRAGWKRKDRAEKKIALLTGRGIAKIYSSSVSNKYQSHYDVVDPFAFVADPSRGFLEDGNYHGEMDIFKTHSAIKVGIQAGIYDAQNAASLQAIKETPQDGDQNVLRNKFDRLKALGIDVEATSFAGQEGANMTEWVMRYNGEWFYLFFDPKRKIWLRAEELKKVNASGKTHFVSWATNYDEYNFWSKGPADDVYPIAEAIRFILNNALENEKRRARPMRIAKAGDFIDVNEIMDYVPDNVILTNAGKNGELITVETPDVSASINIAQFLDTMIQSKSGVAEPGVSESDPKVGVFYGKLQQEADRIGIINKEYSESYAHKGYRFFWGLKQHLTAPKQIEMLGKSGVKLLELTRYELKDVDDVDDVIVSGGSDDQQMSAVESERKMKALSELTAKYPDKMNPEWVIRTTLKESGYEDDDVQQALDIESGLNREMIEEADQAIQDVLLGETPKLNMGADTTFANRILEYVRDNLNWVKLDKDGNEVGIDEKVKKQSDLLLNYLKAHERVVAENMARSQRKAQMMQPPMEPGADGVTVPPMTQGEERMGAAMPFEKPTATPQGAARTSQAISRVLGG